MIYTYLIRDEISSECIRGVLYVKDKIFHTLERPWLNNQSNISCIPANTYNAQFISKSSSGKYRNIYLIKNVPDRLGILIHNGNIVSHTHGCILIGKRRGILAGKRAVLNSKTALYEFVKLMNKEDFQLHIYGSQHLLIYNKKEKIS